MGKKPEAQSLRNARTSNQAQLGLITTGIAVSRGGTQNRATRRAAAKAAKKAK